MKDESTTAEITVIDSPRRNGKEFGSVDFWLGFPIKLRPLKFIPGRNRHEKRTFQKLASQAERGTLSKGHPKGKGGNAARLRGLYDTLKSLGMLKGGEK